MESEKIVNYGELGKLAQSLHKDQSILVLTTGVFDLFHRAHYTFLTDAKTAGTCLLVGLEADDRVQQLKGDDRPYQTLSHRLTAVAAHPHVDYVFTLPNDFNNFETREALIADIQPNIFAVSSHSTHLQQKEALVNKYNGKLRVVTQQDLSISTTLLLQEIKIHKKKFVLDM